jgi:hypothetical protein
MKSSKNATALRVIPWMIVAPVEVHLWLPWRSTRRQCPARESDGPKHRAPHQLRQPPSTLTPPPKPLDPTSACGIWQGRCGAVAAVRAHFRIS